MSTGSCRGQLPTAPRRMSPAPSPRILGAALPLLASLLLFVTPAYAQGSPDYAFAPPTLVSDDGTAGIVSSTESSGQQAMATCGDSVYAVWADERTSPARVYCAKSRDRGASWEPNVAVTDSAAPGAFPALAVSRDGTICVAWQDFRPAPLAKVYAARSVDGGLSFEPSVWVSASLGEEGWDGHPSLAWAGADTVYVAWTYHLAFAKQIVVATSVDGGVSFGPVVHVEYRCDSKGDPTVAATNGGKVSVAWPEKCDYYGTCGFDDDFCGFRIYLATSFDGGQSFRPPRPATPLLGPAKDPALAVASNGNLYLAWSGVASREQDPDHDIYFALNPRGGYDYATSDLVQVDGSEPGTSEQDRPSLAVDSAGNPFVAWRDSRLGGSDIFFAASNDTGEAFGPAARVSVQATAARFPSVRVTEGALAQVAWTQEDPVGGYDTQASRGWPSGAVSVNGGAGGSATPAAERGAISLSITPNPGRPGAVLRWPASTLETYASVYDVAGRLVRSIPGTGSSRGIASAVWDGKDPTGRDVPAGVYFVDIHGADKPMRGRFVLVR